MKSVGVAPLKHFPDISLVLNKPVLLESKETDADTLLEIKKLNLSFDLSSLLRSKIDVNDLSIQGAYLNLKQTQDSTLLLLEALKMNRIEHDTSSGTGMDLSINSLLIEDLHSHVDEKNSAVEAELHIEKLQASFSYLDANMDIKLTMQAWLNSLAFKGNEIARQEKLNLSGGFLLDDQNFSFKDTEMQIAEAFFQIEWKP